LEDERVPIILKEISSINHIIQGLSQKLVGELAWASMRKRDGP